MSCAVLCCAGLYYAMLCFTALCFIYHPYHSVCITLYTTLYIPHFVVVFVPPPQLTTHHLPTHNFIIRNLEKFASPPLSSPLL